MAAAVFVFVGCGSSGSSGDRLSHSEYEAKLQAISGDLKDAMSGASLNSAKTPEDVAKRVDDLRERLANAADKIDGLSPPEDVATWNDTLAEALHQFEDALTKLEDAVKQRSVEGARAATQQVQSAAGSARTAISALQARGYDVGDFAN